MVLPGLVALVATMQTAAAQPRADTSIFRPLELRAASLTRSASGAPGADYWQQRVSYSIAATLDTATQTISGREIVRYVNHAPDTLRYLWFHLEQNLYVRGGRGDLVFPDQATPAGFRGGFTIGGVWSAATDGTRQVALPTTVNGTLLRVDLPAPLAPDDSVQLEIGFGFPIPGNGSDRMGRNGYPGGWTYAIAQWYPRAAVYDDLHGWNTEQYLGQGEFYLEYGDIDYAITVPRSFVVTGTGEITNPDEVLTPLERQRLAVARGSDTIVSVIARREAGTPGSRPTGAAPSLTWRFRAKNVRDVAWAASPTFVWDACGWNGILMQAFYDPHAHPDWARSAGLVQSMIRSYSERWFPYPYPTAISVAAPIGGGMEYPMIVFNPADRGGQGLVQVTLHELGHQWFPMIVGSNERRDAWMDEGFNTFINWIAIGRRAAGNGRGWERALARGRNGPLALPSDRTPSAAYDDVAYDQPDEGLELLRSEILDDTAAFDAAFREYIRRWAFKHPSPADFFRTMEDGLGEDLAWFWRGWFYQTALLDQAVESVSVSVDRADRRITHIHLASRGSFPMPVRLRLGFADGTSEEVKLPVEVWYFGNRYRYDRELPSPLTSVEIDPRQNFPDVRRSNNAWRKP